MVMESREFAIRVISNSDKYAERLREKALDPVTYLDRENLVMIYKRRMWYEYHLGVLPPAKQITQLSPEDLDLRWLLTEQLTEEYHHSKVFSDILKEMGEDPDITHFETRPEYHNVVHHTLDFDTPWEIAASLQVTGEVMLISILKWLQGLVEPRISDIIENEVLIHEGKHVRFGRMILERFATTEERQRRVVEISETKFESLCTAHDVKFYGTIKTEVD